MAPSTNIATLTLDTSRRYFTFLGSSKKKTAIELFRDTYAQRSSADVSARVEGLLSGYGLLPLPRHPRTLRHLVLRSDSSSKSDSYLVNIIATTKHGPLAIPATNQLVSADEFHFGNYVFVLSSADIIVEPNKLKARESKSCVVNSPVAIYNKNTQTVYVFGPAKLVTPKN